MKSAGELINKKGQMDLFIAFLFVVSMFASVYAMATREFENGIGFLFITMAFLLVIPKLTQGFLQNILMVLSLILYLLGIFMIVRKNKVKQINSRDDKKDNNSDHESS